MTNTDSAEIIRTAMCGELRRSTETGLDYTPAELDDLVDRKVEAVPFSGDDLARIIRARRGTARATLSEDHYADVTDSASFGLWNDVTHTDGNRRMAAVGRSQVGDAEVLDCLDVRHADGSRFAL